MFKFIAKFIADVRDHAYSNLSDIYFGEMRDPTRQETAREFAAVAVEHIRYAFHGAVTCRVVGHDMACEEFGDAETGPMGSGYCARCMTTTSW